jgi:mannosylglycerate hydrolase
MSEKKIVPLNQEHRIQGNRSVEARKMIQCHFISNTHWDREWRFSMQRTRFMLVYMMDMLLDIFEKEPKFKSFHLDSQTVPLQDYLDIRPEKKDRIKQLIENKKLLVGPWFVLPDEFSVAGESLVRNLLLGHKIAQDFGHVSKTGYSPFSWGQISQMPQIYQGFGIPFAAFYRGINTEIAPQSEFLWEGADGTQLVASRLARRPRYNVWYILQRPAYWDMQDIDGRVVPWNCGHGPLKFVGPQYHDFDAQYTRPKYSYNADMIRKHVNQAIEEQNGHWTTAHRLWSCGHDSSCPDIREVQMMVDCHEALRDTAEVFHSTFERFQKAVVNNVKQDLTVAKGEMRHLSDSKSTSPLYGWITSARMDLKQDNFKTEVQLWQYAEPLAVFASLLGAPYPKAFLDQAAHWLLQNHGHDSIGGCSREIVGQDMLFRSRQSREIAACISERALLDVAGAIDYTNFAGEDMVLLVYNPAPFQRSDIVELNLQLPRDWDVVDFDVLDEQGNASELQVIGHDPNHFQIVQSPNDTANMFETQLCRVKLKLNNLPAMGYKIFSIHPVNQRKPRLVETLLTSPLSMENEHLKVQINDNGTLTLTDKHTLHTFDQIGYFRDTAEVGDPWNRKDVENPAVYTTLSQKPDITLIQSDPLETVFRVRFIWSLPKGRSSDEKSRSDEHHEVTISSRISLKKDQRFVEIVTDVDNTVEDHYLQVVFPSHISATHVDAQGQYDVLHRAVKLPRSANYLEDPQTEQPMNSFIDISDGEQGLAVLNEGLKAYEATEQAYPELRLTLLRSFPLRICVTQEMMDYSGVDKSSQCLGSHRFRYAVMPHKGKWDEAKIWQTSEQFNLPLVVAQTAPTEAGTEPPEKSFLEVTPVIHVSAVKQSENGEGWIVRLFNPLTQTVQARVRLNGGMAQLAQPYSPVERLQHNMALVRARKSAWQSVRQVTLEEIPDKDLTLDAQGWCTVSMAAKKIVTLEFLVQTTSQP